MLRQKSDCSLRDDETIPRLAAAEPFPRYRVGDQVLLSAGYPRTAEALRRAGYTVTQLATSETAKIDAGLS